MSALIKQIIMQVQKKHKFSFISPTKNNKIVILNYMTNICVNVRNY